MDIWGAASVQAKGGYYYLLTLVDDATRWCTMRPLRNKDDALKEYVIFATRLFTHQGKKVKFLQSNNNTVFLDHEFTDFLDSQGTVRRLTIHDTPSQNGVAERMHQIGRAHV